MTLKERFRQIKKLPGWIYWPPAAFLKTLCRLMRVEITDPHGTVAAYTESESKIAVTVTWHNRLLFLPALFPLKVRKRTVAVISASRDGQYIADLVARFGVRSVRGSTSRKAVEVLHNAVKTMKSGSLISFTPDGPRGPCYHMGRGPIQLASMMHVPIIPLAINYSDYWQLGSWDRFQIPKPWAKVHLIVGDEIPIPENLTREEFEQCRQTVEKALFDLTVDRPEKSE